MEVLLLAMVIIYLAAWIRVLYSRKKHKSMLHDLQLKSPEKTFIQKAMRLKSSQQKEVEKAIQENTFFMIILAVAPIFLMFLISIFSMPMIKLFFDLM